MKDSRLNNGIQMPLEELITSLFVAGKKEKVRLWGREKQDKKAIYPTNR
jgi:hypothetical protein